MRLSGIRRVKKSREADVFMGSLPPEEARWLLRVIKQIAIGEIDVYPSLLYPNLCYSTPDGMSLRISVKGHRMVLLDIKRRAG